MPLTPGDSKENVSQNIKEMMAAGYPQVQAVAAALSNARKTGRPGIKQPKPKKVGVRMS